MNAVAIEVEHDQTYLDHVNAARVASRSGVVDEIVAATRESAIREGRAPRVPAIMFMIGGGLIAMAKMQRPGGYQIEDNRVSMDL